MEPEQLKVIAEGMGWTGVYVADHLIDKLVLGVPPECTYEEEFIVNVEAIMEKLAQISSIEISKSSMGTCMVGIEWDGTYFSGKTISEAVCNAAFNLFNRIKK